MAFATVAELEDWLGYALDPSETDRATLLLDVASATIQAHTRQTIELVSDDVATLQGTWQHVLTLPERPVVSVSSVVLDGTALTVGDDYVVVRDELRRPRSEFHNWQMPSSDFYPFTQTGWGGPSVEVVVTYTHGYATIPADIKGVCLSLAARAWTNPENVRSKMIDAHQFTFGERHLDLTDGEIAVLNRYRRRVAVGSVW